MPETTTDTAPIVERVIRRKTGLIPIDFAELYRFRELLVFLALRDVLIRYKQTVLGVAWAVIQPMMEMVVFTVIFGRLAKFPSGGAPYAVMTFAAILPWHYFSSALSSASGSVVAASNMIRKIYFPRLILPAQAVLSGLVDFAISFIILIALMLYYRVAFHLQMLFLPLFLLLAMLSAFSVSLWLSALNVKYRDVKHTVPFLVRIGMYISPVGFMSSVVPEKWRFWYSLNPLVGVIDGFRWCVLGDAFEPYWPGVWLSVVVVSVVLVSGAYYFRSTERTFADVI